MVDGWKNSSNNKKFLVYTLRNTQTHQVYLHFHDVSAEVEDGDSLAKNIVCAIKLAQEKYNSLVCAIITDNDQKIKCGAELASQTLFREGIIDKPLLLATCYSHSGNLLIKSIVNDEVFIAQLRDVVNAFSSPKMASYVYDNGGCKLRNFPDTRFCYIRYTCESILSSLDALKNICEMENLASSIKPEIINLVQSSAFERKLYQTIRCVTPICKLINNCQDPEVNIADGTQQWLTLKLDSAEHERLLQERISNAIHPVDYAANLMHQQYKGECLDEDQKQVAMKFLTNSMNDAGKIELEDFLEKRNEFEEFTSDCKNPVAYWSVIELKYPILGSLCKKKMLIPASTALLEGLFSQWTDVHNKYRNRLSNTTTGLLLDVYHLTKHLDDNVWTNTVDTRKRKRLDIDEDYY